MKSIISVLPFMLQVALALAVSEADAPGRSDRMFYKRARVGKKLADWEPDCNKREAACNNACYYIRCMAQNTPDANKIVYIGKNKDTEREANRRESGCRVNNPQGTSVCGAFPFSQKFSNPLARDWECDEWPPASALQAKFGTPGRIPNSLRCMTKSENGSLGGLLGNHVKNADENDYFFVNFGKNIASADQSKVKYCLPQLDCTQDGKQFQLSEKLVQKGGKISSPYNTPDANGKKNDNKYKLSNSPYKELYQCSTKFTRVGDSSITDAKVDNFDEKPTNVPDFNLPNNRATFLIKGLPKGLQVRRTGALGTKLEFEYAPGEATNPNYFKWDSDMEGSGRGPFTNDGKPRRFCKVESLPGKKQLFNCWFPCYEHGDGK